MKRFWAACAAVVLFVMSSAAAAGEVLVFAAASLKCGSGAVMATMGDGLRSAFAGG
jgi:hypothetical protein